MAQSAADSNRANVMSSRPRAHLAVSPSTCSSCRGGDQLIHWVTGLLGANRMQIESLHHPDTHRVCVLPLAIKLRARSGISSAHVTKTAPVLPLIFSEVTPHQPLFALMRCSSLSWPGSRVLKGTRQPRSLAGRRREALARGEKCLGILTCQFPPCENAVAARSVSVKAHKASHVWER